MITWKHFAVTAVLALTGCVANEEGGFYDSGVGGAGGVGGGQDPGDDTCALGCLQLETCDRCLDSGGACLSAFDCAEQCRANGDQGTALCLTQVAACDATALDACIAGDAVDVCFQACGTLAGCDTCLTDEAGTCLDDFDCVNTCRAGLPGAECLAGLNACDAAAIEACLIEDDGAGDDACADACRVIDGCGQCITGEDEMCISVADCAAECREGWADMGACINDLDMCDGEAIGACLDGRATADDCAQGCLFLDDCGYCTLDEADDCLSVADCAEACRADDPTENACLRGLDSCDDEDAILACLTPAEQPVGADECARACAALDGCGLCWPDDAGDCMDLATCAESCRMGDPGPESAACLSRLESCDEAPLNACFDAPPSVCTTTCTALQGCGQIGEDDNALATCVSQCEADPEGEIERCRRDSATCDEIAACVPAVDPCEAVCDRWVECADPEQEGPLGACLAACPDWTDAQRGCVLDTPECADVPACVEPAPEPCEAACDRWVECSGAEDVDAALAVCRTDCPAWPEAVVPCITDAAECQDVLACDPVIPEPPACADVCARRLECDQPEDPDAFTADCLVACEGEVAEVRACVLQAAECADVRLCAPQ